jgi:hypothetical protein
MKLDVWWLGNAKRLHALFAERVYAFRDGRGFINTELA